MEMNLLYQQENLTVQSNASLTVAVSRQEQAPGVTDYCFQLRWRPEDAERPESQARILFRMPCVDVQYAWHPESRARRVLDSDWRLHHQSMLTGSAPLAVAFNGAGENVYTFAASEVRKTTALHLGVHDETNEMHCELTLGLSQFRGQKPEERLLIRADFRPVPFHRAVTDACRWWDETLQLQPMPVPESCRLPLYSSWYNFHQGVTAQALEKECALAKDLGMAAVILDDGWHSAHDGPGYGYTGDWAVCREKFPDMRAHVAKVHALGMKYMLWFSVPFVGYHAQCWPRFQDKLLRRIDRNACGVLDPRYPDVRDYLIETYARAVREYDLDGLKLDFIDQFEDRDCLPLRPGMDYACVQEATQRLMTDVMERVRSIKPEAMIEFRQRYIGPAMHCFGNMFRVGDCASDIVSNRVGVTDLRLLSGSQAVHSDMLTWSREETPEYAALQILNVLFGTIQLSQIIADMPEAQLQMTRFWLGFAVRYRKVLLESEFIPLEPQFLYPVIQARDAQTAIIAVYAPDKLVRLDTSRRCILLINATHAPVLHLQLEAPCAASLCLRNTLGEITEQKAVSWQPGIVSLPVPCSGLAELTLA